jgi:hypothetical protein
MRHHIEYHGWVSSIVATPEVAESVESELRSIQRDYPLVVRFVNGVLHIMFSGAPNHYGNQAYLALVACQKIPNALGQVYLIDHDADGANPHVLILADGEIEEKIDSNVPSDKYRKWWKGEDDS